ncbi:MAG: hypothetical protein Ta2D_12840 [Rickettsiales bacterium]|nr:MAG: hypothetical protein Ta2D_12840 [Rickettsiales bacterium]
MRKNNNIINSSEVVHFKDVNGNKDRQGNIQTHHIEIKYINDYKYRINKLLEQNAVVDATKENDSDFIGMDKKTMSRAVFDYHFNNGYGIVLNTKNKPEFNNRVIFKDKELGKIELSKKDIVNSIQHSYLERKNDKVYLKDDNQAIAFKFLDKIIENGIIISKELNWKDDQNQYNTYLMGTCIKINDKDFIVESIIKELNDKDKTKQFHIHNVVEKEKFIELLKSQELFFSVSAKNRSLKNTLETIKSNIADFNNNVKYFLSNKKFQELFSGFSANNESLENILGDIKSNIADFNNNVKYFLHKQNNINNSIKKCLLFLFFSFNCYASGYIRKVDSVFLTFEYLTESNALLNAQKPDDYWEVEDYKVYGEYGLFTNTTIGGSIKQHNFLHKLYFAESKIENDYYANIFFSRSILKNRNAGFFLSYSIGYYFPVKYDKQWSPLLNNIDTKKSFDFTGYIFKSGTIADYNYYIDTGITYKKIKNGFKDELKEFFTVAVGERDDNSFGLTFEQKSYVKGDNVYCSPIGEKTCYGYDNSKMLKLFANYKFEENVGAGFSIYRKFSTKNSSGISLNIFY